MPLALLIALPLIAPPPIALPLLAAAPEAATICPVSTAPWSGATRIAAATDGKGVAVATLPVSKPVTAGLRPAAQLAFVAPPAKAPAAGSWNGMLGLRVPKVGSYRIALGGAAWIDVLRDGKPVVSTAHAHGAACSGIHKMVDFALTPGTYVVQISGSADATVPVLVTPLP